MSNTKISGILAIDLQDGIGKDGGLPWHIPEDFKHFKRYTEGKTCLMGRRTYEDILSYKKNTGGEFLPGRVCVVLTSNDSEYTKNNTYDGVTFLNKDIVKVREDVLNGRMGDEVCVIGGVSLFEEFSDLYDELSITEIRKDFECDTFIDRKELTFMMELDEVLDIQADDEDYAVDVLIFKKTPPDKTNDFMYEDDLDLGYHELHSGKD